MVNHRTLTCLLLSASAVTAQAQDPDERTGPSASFPAASPDGQKIVFVSDAGASKDIWIVNRDGSNVRPLINWSGSDELAPDWSPDGKILAFASTRNGGKLNIWATDQNGANPKQLTSGGANNSQPRYSPDGARIAFTSDRTGKRELWIMNADGTGQHSVGLISKKVSDPAWSPDGSEIAYVGCSAGSCNLYAITADGARSRQITFGQANDWQPHWSSWGIVFASDRDGLQSIWVVAGTGSGIRSFTNPGPTGDMYPRWDKTGGAYFSRAGLDSESAGSNIWYTNGQGAEKRITNIQGTFMSGDANGDGKTDCADLEIVKKSFGARIGQGSYDTRADLNGDGIVDLRDLTIVSKGLSSGITCK